MLNLQADPKKKAKRVVVIQAAPNQNKRVQNDVRLQLTHDVDFSMTRFDKVNKGFSNKQKINCFMNVCLQSLFACPAMFNLLTALSETDLPLDPSGTVSKLVHLAKHFDSKY